MEPTSPVIRSSIYEENSDDSKRLKKAEHDNDTSGVLLDLSNIPLEILELILSHLTDPISQRRLELVCKQWRQTVIRLRWLRLVSFERKLHLRLPLAGSLHEVQGNEGFSLLLCVDSPVLLAGTAVFLPYKENVRHDVSGNIQLVRHGTPHQGPVGEKVMDHQFHLTKEQALHWQDDCHGQTKSCMQGPLHESNTLGGGTLGSLCRGLHPLPVMFHCVLELEPGVRYLLNLNMVEKNEGCVVSEQIGTVWGYEGVPKRRKEESDDQNHFRWFQVYRHNMTSSVSSGQFPIIYYIA